MLWDIFNILFDPYHVNYYMDEALTPQEIKARAGRQLRCQEKSKRR